MKNICFILTTLGPGGTERYLLRFLQYTKGKIRATVICKSGELGSLEKSFRETNAEIIPIKVGYFNFIAWIKIYKIFKKNKFNSVADLTGNFGGIFMAISYFSNIKKRVTFYRYSSNQFVESRLKLLYNNFVKFLVHKFSTSILSNSKTAIKFFFPSDFDKNEKFKVIFNGVDFDDFVFNEIKESIRESLGIKKNIFLVGHIGRYDSSKNHKTILKVAQMIHKMDSGVEFLFCGLGTDSREFILEIEKCGLSSITYTLGEKNNIPQILRALDVFYFPSITEGQPNALIEAMLSNLPIITSDIDPIREIIPKKMEKYLLPPLEVEKVVEILFEFKNNLKIQDEFEIQKWAIERFNSKTNFDLFESEL